jgi:hypothetical protein
MIKDILSTLTPSFPLLRRYSPFSYLLFLKLTDRYKRAQPIEEIFPNPPLSICSGGWIAEYGVDNEIR